MDAYKVAGDHNGMLGILFNNDAWQLSVDEALSEGRLAQMIELSQLGHAVSDDGRVNFGHFRSPGAWTGGEGEVMQVVEGAVVDKVKGFQIFLFTLLRETGNEIGAQIGIGEIKTELFQHLMIVAGFTAAAHALQNSVAATLQGKVEAGGDLIQLAQLANEIKTDVAGVQ